MRERAGLVPPSPWFIHGRQVTTHDGCNVISDSGRPERTQYIASMHPGVAVAVADWLDETAEKAGHLLTMPECGCDAARCDHKATLACQRCCGWFGLNCGCWDKAVAVARTYLESAPVAQTPND
jgi:hypothetical protein